VDLEDIEGKTARAEYDMFAVTSERTKYQLSLGAYSGEHVLYLLYFSHHARHVIDTGGPGGVFYLSPPNFFLIH